MEQNQMTKDNIFQNPSNFPYKELVQTELYRIISQSIDDLEENQDINITTNKEYVIGYICKMILKTKGV